MTRFPTLKISSALLTLFICMSFSQARDYLVGGKSNSWKIPSSETNSLNHWAQKSRFIIGDSLVWEYENTKDSVLQVSRKDYVTCNTTSLIKAYSNVGNITVKLDRSGPYYFISGAEGHCQKGQKLIVVVMSEKHSRRFVAVSPAPSPAEIEGSAVAPAPTNGVGRLKSGVLFVGVCVVMCFVMENWVFSLV